MKRAPRFYAARLIEIRLRVSDYLARNATRDNFIPRDSDRYRRIAISRFAIFLRARRTRRRHRAFRSVRYIRFFGIPSRQARAISYARLREGKGEIPRAKTREEIWLHFNVSNVTLALQALPCRERRDGRRLYRAERKDGEGPRRTCVRPPDRWFIRLCNLSRKCWRQLVQFVVSAK